MPSTREIAAISLAGTISTAVIAAVFDLGVLTTLLVAVALSVNYWAVRGLLKARRDRQR